MTVIQSPDTDDNEFDAVRFGKISMTVLDLILNVDPMYRNIVIMDVKDMTMSKFLSFTPTITKNLMYCSINAFPLRLKAIHFINPPVYLTRMITFLKMFVSNKIKNRMIIHETLEDLYKSIPKDILPEEYGGTCGNVVKMQADLMDYLMANQEQITSRPTADLSKRPKQSKSDELDMTGTFKTLEID